MFLASGLHLVLPSCPQRRSTDLNVATLAASTSGPISYTDSNALVLGTVTDTAMTPNASPRGISRNNSDGKLTVVAGCLTIGAAADAGADDISLGRGYLILDVTGI